MGKIEVLCCGSKKTYFYCGKLGMRKENVVFRIYKCNECCNFHLKADGATWLM